MNTLDLFNILPVNDEDKALLVGALCGRGKNKGYLLQSKPKRKDAAIAWLAIVGNLAPSRLEVFTLMTLSQEERAIYEKLDRIALRISSLVCATEPAFRWNVWALNHDSQYWIPRIPALLAEWQENNPGKTLADCNDSIFSN